MSISVSLRATVLAALVTCLFGIPARATLSLNATADSATVTSDKPIVLTNVVGDGDHYALGWASATGPAIAAGGASFGNEGRGDINAYGSGNAQFTDTVTINDPARTGTKGMVTIGLAWDARLAGYTKQYVGAISVSQYSVAFGSGGGLSGIGTGDWYTGDAVVNVGPPSTMTSPFTFGQPFTASIFVSSQTRSTFFESGAEAMTTIAFEPITTITDADGNVVPISFTTTGSATPATNPTDVVTVSSDSGINYFETHDFPQIVTAPEPATLSLAALTGVALFHRRRRAA